MKNKLSLFIIGMPRSGTKLLRDLLNNHSDIYIPYIETLFIPSLIKKYSGKGKLNKFDVDEIIIEIQKSLFFFYYLEEKTFNFDRLKISDINISQFIDLLFNELCSQNGKKNAILGDKSPNYIFNLDILTKNYTNAKFIHIVRDPRDYAISVNKAWGKNLFRASYYWNKGINNINNYKPIIEDNLFEIKYEDLITKTKESLIDICNFLDLSFQNNMLKLNHSVENSKTIKSDEVVASNFGKYKILLQPNKLKKIEELTSNLLSQYGYETEFNVNLKTPSKIILFYWKFLDSINLILHNVRNHGVLNGTYKIVKALKYS